MAHNILTTNDLATHSKAVLQTTTRPVLVQYTHTPTSSTKPVLVQIDVFVEDNGTFIEVGSTQVSSKDFTSTSTNTTFTFDISSMLQSRISSGFYESIFTTNTITSIDFKHSTSNQAYKSVIKYKTSAKSWFVNDSGEITLDLNAGIENPSSGDKFACDLFFKNKFLSDSSFVNLDTSSPFIIESPSDVTNARFLTNCPTSLRRKIAIGMPLSLSVLHLGSVSQDITVRCVNTPSDGVFQINSLGSIITASENSATIKTKNLTLTDTYLFLQTGSSQNTVTRDISFRLQNDAADHSKSLKFEVTNNEHFGLYGTSNSNLDGLNKDSTSIYFINDYGVLDYFTFDSNLDVVHEHSKTTFKTGYKDFTSRISSKQGVSSGKTVEIHSCYSYVNKETSEWLSEICRSKEVYLYDREDAQFVPIIVLEGETQPSYSNSNSVQPFSISFIKDTHVIKK